jgi:hypothetical protein
LCCQYTESNLISNIETNDLNIVSLGFSHRKHISDIIVYNRVSKKYRSTRSELFKTKNMRIKKKKVSKTLAT